MLNGGVRDLFLEITHVKPGTVLIETMLSRDSLYQKKTLSSFPKSIHHIFCTEIWWNSAVFTFKYVGSFSPFQIGSYPQAIIGLSFAWNTLPVTEASLTITWAG